MRSTLLPDTASTIGSWAQFIAQGLTSCGIDSHQLFLDAGINLAETDNPNARFPVHKMSRVWQLAVARSGDPCIALTLATGAYPGMYGGLGLSMISSRTLWDAVSCACRFNRIASDAATLLLRERSDGNVESVYLMSEAEAAAVTGEALEAFMATSTHILRSISHDHYAPLEVHFQHNKEAHRQAYEDFFRAPVFFDAEEYKIVLARKDLDQPCLQANPELAATIDAWMSEYLARFNTNPLSAKVRKLLTEKLPDGELMQNDVSTEMAMSTRSLQRGLKNEGTSFKELLDVTRQDLALKYISEHQLAIIEICCLLGFSDQSNFTKAFKRWTGQAPSTYRQGLAH